VLIVLGAFAFGGMVIGAGLSAAIRRAPQLDVVNRSPDLPER
jgi:acyl-CoA thioesterase